MFYCIHICFKDRHLTGPVYCTKYRCAIGNMLYIDYRCTNILARRSNTVQKDWNWFPFNSKINGKY